MPNGLLEKCFGRFPVQLPKQPLGVRAQFDNNRFGGQIGGPVLKNKLFFFVNAEYEPFGQAGGAGAVCSPTGASFAVIHATPGLSATNVAIFEKYVAPGTNGSSGCAPIN